MNDCTVLHLSDLHISTSGKRLSLLMENLLKDIEKEMRYSKHIMIVVTGDIVDRAEYKNRDNVIEFFTRLKKCLGNKCEHIYIVPGNHDKVRNELDERLYDIYEQSGKEDYSSLWRYVESGFKEYLKLVEDIYKIFYKPEIAAERLHEHTFGINIDEIDGKCICVIQFNTAWYSKGNMDRSHLKVGKYQMETIWEEYSKLYENLHNKKIDLTIAIAHHPVNWLQGPEEDMVQAELLNNNRLNANVYMCGHTHVRDVIIWQNNIHSMTTLVSGLGWPDGNEEHSPAHTYSSYVFNLNINSIDVYVRSSNDDSSFEPDFRIYTEKRQKEDTKIIMPINTRKTQAYFKLGTFEGRSPKGCYITEDDIDQIQFFAHHFEGFRQRICEREDTMKHDLFEIITEKESDERKKELEKAWFEDNGPRNIIKDMYEKNKHCFHMQFSAYLQFICSCLFGKGAENSEKYNSNSLRAFFWYYHEDKYYLNSMQCSTIDEQYEIPSLEWGNLFEQAYKKKAPLIASVNQDECNENRLRCIENNSGKILDYLVACPLFHVNRNIKRNLKTDVIALDKPWLIFCITITEEKDRRVLYLLDYLRIDKIIGDCCRSFLYNFSIDLESYCNGLSIGGKSS